MLRGPILDRHSEMKGPGLGECGMECEDQGRMRRSLRSTVEFT